MDDSRIDDQNVKFIIEPLNPGYGHWLKRATIAWGKNAQMDLVLEEMAELMKAILKERRMIEDVDVNEKDKILAIAGETADVEMMLRQVINNFDIKEDVERIMAEKFERFKQRVIKREKKMVSG